MKKLIEGELISIAHRVLKLKNRSETKQLLDETQKLYEQLTLLHFYENNIALVEKEISKTDWEEKIAALPTENTVLEVENEVLEEKVIQIETIEEEIMPTISEKEDLIMAYEEEEVFEKETKSEDIISPILPEEIKEQLVTNESLFSNTLDLEYGKMPEFVRPEENTPKAEETIAKPVAEETKKATPKEDKTMSLNDILSKGVIIGLNDRIAFEKKLFGGSTDAFNRVLSQLNTFDSYEEASGFIETFVKPDYNNWDGNEEYETRFMELVAKKFN